MSTRTRPAVRIPFARFLNARSAQLPVFSHDDRSVLFVADITGVPQIWQVPVEGGWPDQRTFTTDRVTTVHACRHSSTLIFGMDSGGNEREQIFALRGGDLTDLVFDPAVFHHFGALSPDDGQVAFTDNRRHPAFFDVYIRDVDGSIERCVLENDGSNFVVDWSPDGSKLLVSRLDGLMNTDLFLVDIVSGEATHLTPHTGLAVYQSARFAPDGSIYLVSDQDSEYKRLGRLDTDTRHLDLLTPDDCDIDALRTSPDERLLALVRNVDGYGRLAVRNVETGEEREPLGLSEGVGFQPEWSHDSTRLAFSHSGPADNLNIWVWDIAGASCRRLTRVAQGGIPRETFITPELVRYPSYDGLEIPAFLYMPDVEQPPVVLHVHGGPEGQAQPIFSAVIQYFISRGYAVLAPNVRGSIGYGRTYTHLDDVEKRMDSVADLKAAADWLRESGRVDINRIAVMGGSYGGFMVLAALTTYPDVWAAGVDIVGIANFETFLRNTGAYRRAWRIPEYGDPDRDADLLRRISPINSIDRIRAPLMVIHGDNDPRVPLSEAQQVVAAVKERGLPVEFLRFADEGHGILKLENKLVAYAAVGEFLDRFL